MSVFKYLFLIVVVTGLTFLIGCSNDNNIESNEQHEEEQDHVESEVVELSDEELNEFGIELNKAGAGNMHEYVSVPGEVTIPPDNLAHIHPRFPGIVKKVYKHIGDKVTKGDVLAIIESNESLSEYNIRSLISGTLIEKHLTLGEVIVDSQHGFVVADLSHVWIKLQLYQNDIPFVKAGQEVIISSGQGLRTVNGTIDYISPTIDELTRTAEARVILKNPTGYWKPGLFVSGQITTSNVEVDIKIPKTAVEYYEDREVVFVKTADGFEPRPIQIGRTNNSSVEIIAGLKSGEIYVSKGGFTIKAELQKSELGDGDEH